MSLSSIRPAEKPSTGFLFNSGRRKSRMSALILTLFKVRENTCIPDKDKCLTLCINKKIVQEVYCKDFRNERLGMLMNFNIYACRKSPGVTDMGFVFFLQKKILCTPFSLNLVIIFVQIGDFPVKTRRRINKQTGMIQNKGVVFAKRGGIY